MAQWHLRFVDDLCPLFNIDDYNGCRSRNDRTCAPTERGSQMTSDEVTRLVDQLKQRFEAQVERKEISPGRFRLSVVSPQFSGVRPLQRQDLIWEAIDALLD